MFAQCHSDVNRLKENGHYQNALKKLEMLDKQMGELTVAEKGCGNRTCQSNELALSEMRLAMSRLLHQTPRSESNDINNIQNACRGSMSDIVDSGVNSSDCSPKRYNMETSSSYPEVTHKLHNNNNMCQSSQVQQEMHGLAPQSVYRSPLCSPQSINEEILSEIIRLASLRLIDEQPSTHLGSTVGVLDPSNLCTGRYKTELCRTYVETGRCNYNDKCQFAHGEHEMRSLPHHPKYKTELCRTFHTVGLCQYGPRCHFVHRTSESGGGVGVGLNIKSRRDSTGENSSVRCSSLSPITRPVYSPPGMASSKYAQRSEEGINMEAFNDALAWFSRR